MHANNAFYESSLSVLLSINRRVKFRIYITSSNLHHIVFNKVENYIYLKINFQANEANLNIFPY